MPPEARSNETGLLGGGTFHKQQVIACPRSLVMWLKALSKVDAHPSAQQTPSIIVLQNPERLKWQSDGACVDVDADIFFSRTRRGRGEQGEGDLRELLGSGSLSRLGHGVRGVRRLRPHDV